MTSIAFATAKILGGRYELRERIGRGGSGEVYRARDLHGLLARDVCVKRLVAFAPELVRAMWEEARLLATLRHANLVSLLDVGEEEEPRAPYLVLELIEGTTLSALSRALVTAPQEHRLQSRGALPDPVCVHVACAVLRALAAVQRAIPGLVHRDVTPHNVLLSNEGEVKLSDFGIALARDRARWTQPFVVKGKAGYVSPEYVRGENLDVRADLFAVGVMLFELFTRVRPWGRSRGMLEALAIERDEKTPLAALRPDLDARLVAATERLLAHERARRFAMPDEALRALAPFSAGDLGSLRLASVLDLARSQPEKATVP